MRRSDHIRPCRHLPTDAVLAVDLLVPEQRLQQQQREQRTELHSVTCELDKRKNELRQVTEQLKARRSMLKGSGSPRPPSPPRSSSPRGDSSSTSSSSSAEPAVPRLPVGSNAPSAAKTPSSPSTASSAASPSASTPSKGKGSSAEPEPVSSKEDAEKIESLEEELEDARGDLQLTISDLRVILEATPAFVCAVDPHGHVSGWNTAAIEITGLRRDSVLQRHFVEHFVPQQHQQAAADAMEAAFSLPPDDPLASEPGDPFDLTLWRGSSSDRNATVSLRVRAYARRLAGGQPVGLLLIQDDASTNDAAKKDTVMERELIEAKDIVTLREQELEEHEAELGSLRAELQTFYEEKARQNGRVLSKPISKEPTSILSKGAAAGQQGSGQRVAWGAPNQIGHFTKGSSPREFGNKQRHDQMRSEAMGATQQQQQQQLPAPRKV